MTVKELVELLETLPEDMKVMGCGSDENGGSCYFPMTEAYIGCDKAANELIIQC